jgi:hypothetical protein
MLLDRGFLGPRGPYLASPVHGKADTLIPARRAHDAHAQLGVVAGNQHGARALQLRHLTRQRRQLLLQSICGYQRRLGAGGKQGSVARRSCRQGGSDCRVLHGYASCYAALTVEAGSCSSRLLS